MNVEDMRVCVCVGGGGVWACVWVWVGGWTRVSVCARASVWMHACMPLCVRARACVGVRVRMPARVARVRSVRTHVWAPACACACVCPCGGAFVWVDGRAGWNVAISMTYACHKTGLNSRM